MRNVDFYFYDEAPPPPPSANLYMVTPLGKFCADESLEVLDVSECQTANQLLGNQCSGQSGIPSLTSNVNQPGYDVRGCQVNCALNGGSLVYHSPVRPYGNDIRMSHVSQYYQICRYSAVAECQAGLTCQTCGPSPAGCSP